MTRKSWLCGAVLTLLTACGVSGAGGAGGGGGGPPRENTAATLTLTGTRFFVEYRNGTIGTLPDGDVVLAALLADDKGYNSDIAVLRLDAKMSLKWVVRIDERDLPTHLVAGRDGALFLISGETYPGSLRVLKLDAATGAVRQAAEYTGFSPGRALPLDDGGLLLAGGNLLRVDAQLEPVWAKSIPATHVIAAGDAFIAAGVPLDSKSRMSGIGLTKVSADGQVAWKSFASPGPGNHSLSGLRLLADGSVMVGLGNNSTRSDNVAVLSPFVLATFDAQGQPRTMSRADLTQQVPTSTGTTEAPLQFGSGHSLVASGEDTWISFTANSGVLGSNVISQVLARFSSDGSLQEALYGGLQATAGPDGSTFSFTLNGPALTLLRLFPSGSGCVKSPTTAGLRRVEGKTEYAEGGAVQVSNISVTPRSLTRTATPLSATVALGCAAP
ncbi:hypothetical protein CYFUS_006820 [Cystobacter fuscus]|uniref:Lipoprotein n=1 Tax=Cystobacter fuscus TaxID=43 RepID=A0A250JBU1_9BACT|nr:hypothetical protein [Cystobacter fuscus]ATB41355.1 hypothetical protein CYFUS_006820 [Cystobacter fuscus]